VSVFRLTSVELQKALLKYRIASALTMTGAPPTLWKKLDPQELRQKLMGYGEHAMNREEPKGKMSDKGLFQ